MPINDSSDEIEEKLENKTTEEQKTILLEILNKEIESYQNICIDKENEECISEEDKTEILTNLKSLKEKVTSLEDNEEDIKKISTEITDYLNTIKPEQNVEETTEESSASPNMDNSSTTSSSNSSSPSGNIKSILNNAKLNPTKTGYNQLDNQVFKVLNSVTNNSMSTYEKVKAVYDWIINNMSYQYGFIIGEEINNLINEYGFYKKDAIQVFLATTSFSTLEDSCDNFQQCFGLN